MGREGDVGTLAKGVLADFVVLSEDIFTVDPAGIREVTAAATEIGGEVVREAALV